MALALYKVYRLSPLCVFAELCGSQALPCLHRHFPLEMTGCSCPSPPPPPVLTTLVFSLAASMCHLSPVSTRSPNPLNLAAGV